MDRGEGLKREAVFTCEEDLRAFAEAFGRCLHGGEVVGLVGMLGAGKTVFTQGLARGLGVPPSVRVVSPTFVLHRRYRGRCGLEHLDAYRLRSGGELDGLDAGQLLEGGAVVVIEWADKVEGALPPHTIWIHFEVTGPSHRRLTLRFPDPGRLPPPTAEALRRLTEALP